MAAVTWAPSSTVATAGNVTATSSSPLGFGLECSGQEQCDSSVGLTCARNENGTSQCACPRSTPVYIAVGGVQKCVASKDLNEPCVSHQECSFRNPNVLCVNSHCNCSQPFQLTPSKLCLLPSKQALYNLTIGVPVSLAFVFLLLVVGYAYRKMRREHQSSSTSINGSRSKRKRQRCPSPSSSTAFILAEDASSPNNARARELLTGHKEACANRGGSETNISSSSALHMLRPKDEEMQNVSERQEAVVTIEAHRPRSLGMAPSPPPVVSLQRREHAQPDSTDDSFMKDLKRRYAEMALFSEDLSVTSTRLSVSAEPLRLSGAAVQSDAAQATTGEGSPGKAGAVFKRPCREAEPSTTGDVQRSERAPSKSPPGSAPLSSSQSTIDYETLDNATIETTSMVGSGANCRIFFSNGSVPLVSSSSGSTTRTPAMKNPASSKAVKHRSVDRHGASEESLRLLLTLFDASEGTVPPSESVSLSFVSSISTSSTDALYRITDLADLPRLENSAAVANRDAGDGGAVLRIPFHRLASLSAVVMDRSRQPAVSLSERAAQTQLLPELVGRSGRLPQTRRREIGPRIATDRPWTEDVEKVAKRGNKQYLGQHALRRPTARSATTFDEAEHGRFKVHDQAQRDSPTSPVATEALASMSTSGNLTQESREPTLILARRCTISSGSDINTVESRENNSEQPLKLSEFILLQYPDVGLRDFNGTEFSWSPGADGGAERESVTLEAQAEGEETLELKTSPKMGADEPTPEMIRLTDSSTKAVDYECWLELEGAVSTRRTVEAAATSTTEPIVRAPPPSSSEHAVFLPNCSVSLRYPGGLIRRVHAGQQGFAFGSAQVTTALRHGQGRPQVLLSNELDEPTFESIYNAILQPAHDVVADQELSAPRKPPNVPWHPSTTRTSSSDASLTTVLPTEQPPASFKYDEKDAMATTGSGAAAQGCTSSVPSSRHHSLSGSNPLAVMAPLSFENSDAARDAGTEVMKLGGSGGAANNIAADESRAPAQPDSPTEMHETPNELVSPYYSFDDTNSSLSVKADCNVDTYVSSAADKEDPSARAFRPT
ncbi:hypothetical protein HPB50_003344 [Hyalomma asiaticum]|uniref:Uncharacterized protein n=1 Tax=Hyalomma asiaticum TaxID=266040 RepID=A0ACB7TC01_HYAAI|nr:hypothetical protein HPB50_003344 [Hyalomma asiaticum]